MALRIIESCVNCYACEPLCPEQAIREAKPHFLIDAGKCTECDGHYSEAQCAAICPIEGAILDAAGEPLNPPGSLTGIPPGMGGIPSTVGNGAGVPSEKHAAA